MFPVLDKMVFEVHSQNKTKVTIMWKVQVKGLYTRKPKRPDT